MIVLYPKFGERSGFQLGCRRVIIFLRSAFLMPSYAYFRGRLPVPRPGALSSSAARTVLRRRGLLQLGQRAEPSRSTVDFPLRRHPHPTAQRALKLTRLLTLKRPITGHGVR